MEPLWRECQKMYHLQVKMLMYQQTKGGGQNCYIWPVIHLSLDWQWEAMPTAFSHTVGPLVCILALCYLLNIKTEFALRP